MYIYIYTYIYIYVYSGGNLAAGVTGGGDAEDVARGQGLDVGHALHLGVARVARPALQSATTHHVTWRRGPFTPGVGSIAHSRCRANWPVQV